MGSWRGWTGQNKNDRVKKNNFHQKCSEMKKNKWKIMKIHENLEESDFYNIFRISEKLI